MRLENVLCVGGKSHAQLVTLEDVHISITRDNFCQ